MMGKWTPEQHEKFKATVAKKKKDAAEVLTKAGWKAADKKAAKKVRRKIVVKRKAKVAKPGVYPKAFAKEAKAPQQDRHKNRPSATSKIDLALKLAEAITLLLK
jgi:hypothetical protein